MSQPNFDYLKPQLPIGGSTEPSTQGQSTYQPTFDYLKSTPQPKSPVAAFLDSVDTHIDNLFGRDGYWETTPIPTPWGIYNASTRQAAAILKSAAHTLVGGLEVAQTAQKAIANPLDPTVQQGIQETVEGLLQPFKEKGLLGGAWSTSKGLAQALYEGTIKNPIEFLSEKDLYSGKPLDDAEFFERAYNAIGTYEMFTVGGMAGGALKEAMGAIPNGVSKGFFRSLAKTVAKNPNFDLPKFLSTTMPIKTLSSVVGSPGYNEMLANIAGGIGGGLAGGAIGGYTAAPTNDDRLRTAMAFAFSALPFGILFESMGTGLKAASGKTPFRETLIKAAFDVNKRAKELQSELINSAITAKSLKQFKQLQEAQGLGDGYLGAIVESARQGRPVTVSTNDVGSIISGLEGKAKTAVYPRFGYFDVYVGNLDTPQEILDTFGQHGMVPGQAIIGNKYLDKIVDNKAHTIDIITGEREVIPLSDLDKPRPTQIIDYNILRSTSDAELFDMSNATPAVKAGENIFEGTSITDATVNAMTSGINITDMPVEGYVKEGKFISADELAQSQRVLVSPIDRLNALFKEETRLHDNLNKEPLEIEVPRDVEPWWSEWVVNRAVYKNADTGEIIKNATGEQLDQINFLAGMLTNKDRFIPYPDRSPEQVMLEDFIGDAWDAARQALDEIVASVDPEEASRFLPLGVEMPREWERIQNPERAKINRQLEGNIDEQRNTRGRIKAYNIGDIDVENVKDKLWVEFNKLVNTDDLKYMDAQDYHTEAEYNEALEREQRGPLSFNDAINKILSDNNISKKWEAGIREYLGERLRSELAFKKQNELYNKLDKETRVATPEERKLYKELADLQRGAPEQAMLALQKANVGGVVSYVAEHLGDILHRMNQWMDDPNFTKNEIAFNDVKTKVDKVLENLKSKYGFGREHAENIESNAKSKGISKEEFNASVNAALVNYARAFEDLPFYNRIQSQARNAAIAFGYQNWQAAILYLEKIKETLDKGPEAFRKATQEFGLGPYKEEAALKPVTHEEVILANKSMDELAKMRNDAWLDDNQTLRDQIDAEFARRIMDVDPTVAKLLNYPNYEDPYSQIVQSTAERDKLIAEHPNWVDDPKLKEQIWKLNREISDLERDISVRKYVTADQIREWNKLNGTQLTQEIAKRSNILNDRFGSAESPERMLARGEQVALLEIAEKRREAHPNRAIIDKLDREIDRISFERQDLRESYNSGIDQEVPKEVGADYSAMRDEVDRIANVRNKLENGWDLDRGEEALVKRIVPDADIKPWVPENQRISFEKFVSEDEIAKRQADAFDRQIKRALDIAGVKPEDYDKAKVERDRATGDVIVTKPNGDVEVIDSRLVTGETKPKTTQQESPLNDFDRAIELSRKTGFTQEEFNELIKLTKEIDPKLFESADDLRAFYEDVLEELEGEIVNRQDDLGIGESAADEIRSRNDPELRRLNDEVANITDRWDKAAQEWIEAQREQNKNEPKTEPDLAKIEREQDNLDNEEIATFTRLMDEYQKGKDNYLSNLDLFARSKGYMIDSDELGVITVRDAHTFRRLFKAQNPEDIRKWINESGDAPKGPDLDGGDNNNIPPDKIIDLPPDGETPNPFENDDFGLVPDSYTAKVNHAVNRIPIATPMGNWFKAIDAQFGTNLYRLAYMIGQHIIRTEGFKLPYLNKRVELEKFAKANKIKKGRFPVITKWMESLSTQNILDGSLGRKLTPEEIEYANKLVELNPDFRNTFEFTRHMIILENNFREKAGVNVAEAAKDPTKYAKRLEKYRKDVDKYMFAHSLSNEDIETFRLFMEVRHKNLRQAKLGFIVDLAQSIINNTPDRETFAKLNNMTPAELELGKKFDDIYRELAPLFGIKFTRGGYFPHFRTNFVFDPASGLLDRLDYSALQNLDRTEKFINKLPRTGEINPYELDPFKALDRYIRVGFDAAINEPVIKQAGKNAIEEINKITNPNLRKYVAKITDYYLNQGLRHKPAGIDKYLEEGFKFFTDTMGFSKDGFIRKYTGQNALGRVSLREIARTLNIVTSGAFLAFRPMQGVRDYVGSVRNYYVFFGKERTIRMMSMPFETDPNTGEPRWKMLKRVSEVPGLGLTEYFGRLEEDQSLFSANMLQRGITKIARAGLKSSLQDWSYSRVQAGAYLEPLDLAAKTLVKYFDKKITPKQMTKTLALNVYELPFVQGWLDKVKKAAGDKTQIPVLARELAQETARMTVFTYGFGNSPYMWGTIPGRMVSQFGFWSASARGMLLQALGRGTPRERLAAARRLATVELGMWSVGQFTGLNFRRWMLVPSIWLGAGPTVSLMLQLQELSGDRGKRRQDIAKSEIAGDPNIGLLPAPFNMLLPGQYAISDWVRALELSDNNRATTTQVVGRAFGIPTDYESLKKSPFE